MHPENWIFLNNLADSLNRMDKFEQALPFAKKAYKLAPTQPAVLDTYGVILLADGDNKRAAKILTAARRRAPNSPEISFNAARALERVGNIDAARSILEEILPKNNSFRSRKAAEKLLKKLGG
jgi:TPR repeat